METLSVTEYAKLLSVTRQAILLQIKEKRLAKGVTCKRLVILILYLCEGKKQIKND